MKIALFVHNLTGGGAERVASLWASGFANRGDSVYIITQDDTTGKRYSISSKVSIVNIDFPIKNKYIRAIASMFGLIDKFYYFNLHLLLDNVKPDICIGVMGSYARELIKKYPNAPWKVIQTYHGAFELPHDAPLIRKRDLKKIFRLDTEIPIHTVLTQADKDYIGEKLMGVHVLPNPLSFQPVTSLPIKEKYITACGRLDVWDVKGFDILIRAWGNICHEFPEWKLQIAGTGSDKSLSHLKDLAIQNGCNCQLDFIGFCDNIIDVYKSSEIFILSSRYEGFGMVLIEAMSQGCACIACDYKGRQKEIIENEMQGITCTADEESLSISMRKMITDGEYRRQCQINGIQRSKCYSIENILKRWDIIFKETNI